MATIDLEKFNEYLNINYQDSPRTRSKYLEIAKRFVKYVGIEFNNETIKQFFSSLNLRKNNQPIRNNTINRATMKSLAIYLNIEKEIEIPSGKGRIKRKEIKFLTKEQIDYIILNTNNRISLMVKLMFDTGLRLSEIINLSRDKIDIEKKQVSGLGKGNKEFCLDFSDITKTILIDYLKMNEGDFPFRYGNKVKNHDKKFQYELKKACKDFGFGVMTPHRIRHSFGHYLRVDKKFDLEQVRYALRHESVETTQIYSTATGDEVRKKIKEEVFKDA